MLEERAAVVEENQPALMIHGIVMPLAPTSDIVVTKSTYASKSGDIGNGSDIGAKSGPQHAEGHANPNTIPVSMGNSNQTMKADMSKLYMKTVRSSLTS
jgi:hypothetical protein